MTDVKRLAAGVLKGDVRSIARSISLVENNLPEKEELIRRLFPDTGKARVIGVTGAPGSGKSTLADKLIRNKREAGEKVAVIAVDPSSPFSRGAILGDRIRMQTHASDSGVYIRSMASRGHLGGVSSGTFDAIKIFDAAGFPYIIIETIGVGQTEVEIVNLSDIILLVLIPGMGDEIQALKAGVMEIGDIYVINKKDIDGADRLRTEVEYALNLSAGGGEQKSVCMVSALNDDGTDELSAAVDTRLDTMIQTGALDRRRMMNTKRELQLLMTEKIKSVMDSRFGVSDMLEGWAREVIHREKDPYSIINTYITPKLSKGE